jgi:hypothetical protein
MDRFVIFNKATGKRYGMESYGGYKEWNTERAAKAALTRLKNKHLKLFEKDVAFAQNNGFLRGDREGMKEFNSDWKVYEALCGSEVVTYDYFYENEPMVERTNLMGGNKYMERLNRPSFLSPASESYYR